MLVSGEQCSDSLFIHIPRVTPGIQHHAELQVFSCDGNRGRCGPSHSVAGPCGTPQDSRTLHLEACPSWAPPPLPLCTPSPFSLCSVRSRVCCLLHPLDSTREILQRLSLSGSLGTVTSKSSHCVPHGRCPSF